MNNIIILSMLKWGVAFDEHDADALDRPVRHKKETPEFAMANPGAEEQREYQDVM